MNELLGYLGEFNTVSICMRLFLATMMGAVIGIERSIHGQAAGVRTFSLVCLGAALAMISDEYLVVVFESGDPARLAAQVISGIGFLGAGSIIVTGRNYIRGLATAASLWTTACLGIAIGTGYIVGSLFSFFMLLFIMMVLSPFSHKIDEHLSTMRLYIEVDKGHGIESLYGFATLNGYRIMSLEKQKKLALQPKDVGLMLRLDLKKMCNHKDVLTALREIEDVHYLEEIS